jgi:hypothetical protein
MTASSGSAFRTFAAVLLCVMAVLSPPAACLAESTNRMILEDFQTKDAEGLPKEWKGEGLRSKENAKQTYMLGLENGLAFLTAKNAAQRVHKKMTWDPKAMPVVTWRWRLKSAQSAADPIAAVYVSLDTDLLFIPVFTKYVWSATKPEGTVTEGGMFSGTEIVVQSGQKPIGEWVEERVNAYEDFKRIHRHEPAAQAWGISLLGGPGVEMDFGPIIVTAP